MTTIITFLTSRLGPLAIALVLLAVATLAVTYYRGQAKELRANTLTLQQDLSRQSIVITRLQTTIQAEAQAGTERSRRMTAGEKADAELIQKIEESCTYDPDLKYSPSLYERLCRPAPAGS